MGSPRWLLRGNPLRVGAAIACGGAAGALARWWAEERWPIASGTFPLSTFAINVIGCLSIGVLMVLIEQVLTGRRYVRPLLGVGLLGGFTTFSAFAVETHALLGERPALALVYYLGTPVAAIAAAITGATLASAALTARASLAARRSES